MAILKLKDDITTIDFVGSAYQFNAGGAGTADDRWVIVSAATDYKLEDNTFSISYPNLVERRADNPFFAARDLLSMNYGSRDISFDFYVYGDTQQELADNISALHGILDRASTNPYLSGGSYTQEITYDQGNDTGDQGCILQIRRGDTEINPNTDTIVSEADNVAETNFQTYTLRVISGQLEIIDKFFSVVDKTADGRFYRLCSLTLSTEPFFVGPSRVVATVADPGLYGIITSDSIGIGSNRVNRLFIGAASIPGDTHALTRISTDVGAGTTGMLIARDAGISILNSTSAPRFTGSGRRDMSCWGQHILGDPRRIRVRIRTGGASFEYAINTGTGFGAFTGNIAITKNTEYQIPGYDCWVMFGASSGYTAGDYWEFDTWQSHVHVNQTMSIPSNINLFLSDSGAVVNTGVRFTIPKGCRGKYKVLAALTAPYDCEYRMSIQYVGYDTDGDPNVTAQQRYEWTGPWPNSAFVDLGIIDLSSDSNPQLSHPNAVGMFDIVVYAKTAEVVSGGAENVNLEHMYLVPVQDEFAYLHAGWYSDTVSPEVYCNYDPSNQYLAEVSTTYYEGTDTTGAFVKLLDGTYAGNVITLVPGVRNTLLFIPLFGGSSADWRSQGLGTIDGTGNTYVAIRPRYLYPPS